VGAAATRAPIRPFGAAHDGTPIGHAAAQLGGYLKRLMNRAW